MSLDIKLIRLTFILLLFSCSSEQESKTEKLKSFIKGKGYEYERFSSVLIITERGCPQCNNSFASLMKQQEDNPVMLYIISAKGTMVDISGLFDFMNVIEDSGNEFNELRITDKSSCIFLSETGKIDTLVEIGAKNLENTLGYIKNRLNQSK